MNKLQFSTVTLLASLSLPLLLGNIALVSMNRSQQVDINQRQQFVQQSVQLEGLYREIVQSLAELGARNNDEAVRAMLARHGITYSVNPTAAAPAPAAPRR